MKKLLFILLTLDLAFILIWTLKLRTPIGHEIIAPSEEDQPWWATTETGEAPTPDAAWILDPEIPENYVPVLNADELYMVIDDNGNILKYRHRYQLEDGTWIWEDTDPNIPENYEAVEGLENVYRVVGEDGSVRYFRYTRNSDDTYFFTEVDEEGNPLKSDIPQGSDIPPNYIRVKDNIYAVYNEYGVLTGYQERYIDANGNYAWRSCDAPVMQEENLPIAGGMPSGSTTGGDIYIVSGQQNAQQEEGYTETETQTDTVKTEDGWTVIYETTITRTYDRSGNLISTKKDGPTEVNRFPTTSINENILPTSHTEPNLKDETVRATTGLQYNDAMKSEIFALLNAQRTENHLSPLNLASSSGDDLAKCKAADMAINGTLTGDSKLYGSIQDMCERFCPSLSPFGESLWRCPSTKSSENIHSRFQSLRSSFDLRMSPEITSIAIAVVSDQSNHYICELYF